MLSERDGGISLVPMILIAAMSEDRVIGSGDGMPWSVPEEYAQFLRFVDGQAVIMGRKSFEIFGPDLTTTHNVVVSRSAQSVPGATVAAGLEQAVAVAESFGKTVFSAGGASIYRQTLPLAEAMYLSTIKGSFTGDAYFPEFSPAEWRVEREEDHPRFRFVVYRRT